MSPRTSLHELDRLMRERAGMAPAPVPVPLHKMAVAGQAAVVIPFPVPLRQPNWELIDRVAAELGYWDDAPPPLRQPNWAAIDRVAAELGLWDPRDPWSLNDELYPPQGVSRPAPGPVLRAVE